MKNILTFEDYKKMNIRQVESVIYHQFIEDNINDDDIVSEGFIRDAINKAAGNFIQTALADEIEKGKELEKSIKEALDGLNKGFEEIEKRINTKKVKDPKSSLAAIEKVKEAIKAVQSQAFDTLTMIGSEGEIDFAGFMGSASVAAAANFGILFTPIRSLFITRKAYKYFLGIIKQTIRRNLLIIQLNFDQFENLILQKSFETDDDSETRTMSNTLHELIGVMQERLLGKDSKIFKNKKQRTDMSEWLKDFKNTQDAIIKQNKMDSNRNPLRSLWEDQHNNTYTRTLEQIKQYINDDSQKELDALKNSITKMAGNDVELVPYGELLISAAEEYAVHTNHGINNNFIKMSSVFNLENQKRLIELIVESQKENEEEAKKKQNKIDTRKAKEKLKKDTEEGKKIYEEKLKDKDTYTFDKFNENFDNSDIECLRAFFISEEGEEQYKELIEKHPLYKYIINVDITALNNLYDSISYLNVIDISSIKSFNENITSIDNTLYYMMAERSIKNAVSKKTPDEYFGFDFVKEYVENNKDTDNSIIDEGKDGENIERFKSQLKKTPIFTIEKIDAKRKNPKTSRYFLTFNSSNGNDIFNILHKDFKTTIFKDGKNEYIDDISIENKKDLMKIISNNLNIGKSISSHFAEYLVRLDANMLLKSPDKPWRVFIDNTELLKYFNQDADKIENNHAFVEIDEIDYDDIKNFLTNLKDLKNNDYNIETGKNEDKKEKD